MYTTFDSRLFRYMNVTPIINKKHIDQINQFLARHTLQEFKKQVLNFNKNHWFFCCHDLFYFQFIASYKQIKCTVKQLHEAIFLLYQKYFDRLHILIDAIDDDFPLYSEYVELMFKYMLDSQVKLSDCISQISRLDDYRMQLDYPNFLPLVKKMLPYCKNEQLKQQVQEKVINRIQNIIDGKQKKLLVYLQPIKFYDPEQLKNIIIYTYM